MQLPTFFYESTLWKDGSYVIGVDEVGRGSFAGPLYVGGVIFPNNMQENLIYEILQNKINDSKLLSKKRRETLSEYIKKTALFCAITSISVEDIDTVGVGKAGKAGFEHTVRTLNSKLKKNTSPFQSHVLTDAFEIDRKEFPNQTPLVHGDRISITIAAASIIAKVARDKYMDELSTKHPEYKWEENKGYGTSSHREALKKFGKTIHHRRDFIRNYISE